MTDIEREVMRVIDKLEHSDVAEITHHSFLDYETIKTALSYLENRQIVRKKYYACDFHTVCYRRRRDND